MDDQNKPERKLDVSDLRSASFWLAQLCMILATIFGVYLASNEGFRKAVEFYGVSSQEGTYQALGALRAELLTNLTLMEDYARAAEETLPERSPELQRYIWSSLRYSERIYELPVPVVNEVHSYYESLDALTRTVNDSGGWAQDRKRALKTLAVQNRKIRETLLPALDSELTRLEGVLRPYGLVSP